MLARRLRLGLSGRERRAAAAIVRSAPAELRRLAEWSGWLCDARVLLALGTGSILLARRGSEQASAARHFTEVIATTTVLHHLIKRVVAQQRPDRSLPSKPTDELTGRAYDAFPSGHAMHAGAIASFLAAHAGGRSWPWLATGALAFARIVTLAHWPSGVVAGYLMGILVERGWRRPTRSPRKTA